jgi:hypothetical protein
MGFAAALPILRLLPFVVTNRSVWFDMNINIVCGVDLFYFMDADKQTGIVRDQAFNVGPIIVGVNSTENYPCSASSYIMTQPDGSLMFGFESGHALRTPPAVFRGPITIIKMCLWMSGTYKTFGFSKAFPPKNFQWPAEPNQRQWNEGTTSPDLPNEAWIPAGSHIKSAWSLWSRIMRPDVVGTPQLIPGALQCRRGAPPVYAGFR